MKNIGDCREDIYISNVKILSGIRPSGRMTDHRSAGRAHHGLLYIFSGEARFEESGKDTVSAKDGDLLYIPKLCKYKMEYSADSTTFVLADFDITSKSGEELSLSDEISVLLNDNRGRRVISVMSALETTSPAENPIAIIKQKELLYKLIGIIFEHNAAFAFDSGKFSPILKGALLLQQTYLENIPISEFAKASNISISSFRSLFTEKYGMSPVQYRNRMRIKRAAALLEEGSCTVSEAAYASGFDNVGYFCRYYKKITGDTPKGTKGRS